MFKGAPEEPVVIATRFSGNIYGGTLPSDKCMYVRKSSGYEKLYSLDVLGVEDREENNQLDSILRIQREHLQNI